MEDCKVIDEKVACEEDLAEDCQEVEECREAPQYMCSEFLPPGHIFLPIVIL